LSRINIFLDHSPTLSTRGIVVYGTSKIYRDILITKMIVRYGPFSELEKCLSVKNLKPLSELESNFLSGPFFELKNDYP
jgi:hypothetical protein